MPLKWAEEEWEEEWAGLVKALAWVEEVLVEVSEEAWAEVSVEEWAGLVKALAWVEEVLVEVSVEAWAVV